MQIDLNNFRSVQLITKKLNRKKFAKLQSLYSTAVILTGPILKKNRRQHPEVDNVYQFLDKICTNPDFICQNRRDPQIAILYKKIGNKRLRLALWLKQKDSPEKLTNSVLSFRLYHNQELETEIKKGRVSYQKQK